MIIAVDFDGTCVTHEYPKVGRDIGAQRVLNKLIEKGHQLILFTMRSDMPGISPVTEQMENGGLGDAVRWFSKNNILLYGIQTNPTQVNWTSSPKAYAQMYIDDAALGCPLIYPGNVEGEFGGRIYLKANRPYVDWFEVERILIKDGIL